MERRLAYPTNPSPVENQHIPESERNDRSLIYIIPNPGKNATFGAKLCVADVVIKEKIPRRDDAGESAGPWRDDPEQKRFRSSVHDIVSGLKADADDDENDKDPFPPMAGGKGQIS